MKKLILILLLFVSANFAQTSTILLLFDDAGSMPITFTGTSTGNITLQGTGVIVVDWGDGSKNSYTLTGSDQNISHNYGSAGTRNIKIDKPKLITKWRQSDATNTWAWDTKYLPNLTYLHLESIKGAMVVNTANITSLTYLSLNSLNTGTISITVNTANITSLTSLALYNLNTGTISITVNTANITSLTSLTLYNLNTGTISITVNTANITS
ncbi:MAG: hypothetical protein LC124_06110, partial [Ignavibacteriales bacterium]|nr:hypothetical protein [Ignavibacteriales bacterium]